MDRATDWLASRARLTPTKEAVVEVGSGLRLTYQQLNLRANRLAGYLQRSGVGRGDRVSLLAPNSVAYLELLFAAGKLGAVFVPLNFRFSISELAYVLSDCQPHVLVTYDAYAEVADALKELTAIPVQLTQSAYRSVVMESDPLEQAADVEMEEPWAIIYTGGTTGKPKGAILSHRAITWNSINTIITWGLTENEITPVYMPLFHTGGLNALTTPILHAGGTIVIGSEFNPSAILDVLEQERCTIALFVPTMHHMLTSMPDFAERSFPSMHTFLSGGAPCPHPIYEAYWAKGLLFKEGYGLTEAGPNNFYIHPNDAKRKIGSIGMPMFHNQVRIVDDSGQDVPCREAGELWIAGPHVFSGYWNNPEKTAETLVDGWLHTGDLARQDEDRYTYIVGRKKDMIITGGENVYPLEIEHVLEAHPDIREVAVVGLADEKWGEVVTAVIVPAHGRQPSEDELKSYCTGKLAGYKIPKRFYLAPELPKTSVGKIDKKGIVTLYSQTG